MEFQLLETARLYLRQITQYDAVDMFEYLSNYTVTRNLGREPLNSIRESYEIIANLEYDYNDSRGMRWAMVHKNNNKLIGTIGYDLLDRKNKRAEIGYDLNQYYWNQGFTTEAISEVIKFGFEQLDINRISAVVFLENKASIKLLEKSGFKKEGILRDYIIQDYFPKDVEVLSLLKREYYIELNNY